MMMGAVGKDLYGDKLLNNLSRVHVDTSAIQKLDDVPTGQAFVSVYDNGDNSIIVIQGANGCVDRAMVDANRKYLDECEYIIMQLEIPLETVQYVKDLAVSKGKKVIIDPAPAVPDLPDSFWKNEMCIRDRYMVEDIRFPSVEADCLYAGIMIDTRNFMNRTGVRTFEAAAFLRRCGADITRVRKMFRDDMASYRAKAEAVRQAEVYRKEYAIAVCPSNIDSPTAVSYTHLHHEYPGIRRYRYHPERTDLCNPCKA